MKIEAVVLVTRLSHGVLLRPRCSWPWHRAISRSLRGACFYTLAMIGAMECESDYNNSSNYDSEDQYKQAQ